jgi:riboflavin kinase / FMN hydrolase
VVPRRGWLGQTGIYYGWAFLRGHVYKAVSSIGWNPYFDNKQKTVVCELGPAWSLALSVRCLTWGAMQEPHLIHEFDDDFYGEPLTVLVLGYIRPERNFPSLGQWSLAHGCSYRLD